MAISFWRCVHYGLAASKFAQSLSIISSSDNHHLKPNAVAADANTIDSHLTSAGIWFAIFVTTAILPLIRKPSTANTTQAL